MTTNATTGPSCLKGEDQGPALSDRHWASIDGRAALGTSRSAGGQHSHWLSRTRRRPTDLLVARRCPAFLQDATLTANQIEFLDMVVEHLTRHGTLSAVQLFEAPFNEVAPRGPT
jgi:EcoEI R protein